MVPGLGESVSPVSETVIHAGVGQSWRAFSQEKAPAEAALLQGLGTRGQDPSYVMCASTLSPHVLLRSCPSQLLLEALLLLWGSAPVVILGFQAVLASEVPLRCP